jgi:hypothetical protein
MISAIKVLNSVTALGTDVSVGSDGILNIASVATVDAYNVRGVSVTLPRAEVSGVVVVTPTAANLTEYNFYINAFSMTTGLPKVINVSFTSAATSASATTISNQARAIINADTDLSVIASGTDAIILTAKVSQPFFVVGGLLANVDSYSGLPASTTVPTTIATNITATNNISATPIAGVKGVSVRGSVAYLQNKYAYSANGNALNYNELALLTSGYYYTEVVISYITTTPSGSGAFKGEISTLETVVLVRFDTAATTPSTVNYNDLLGTYGTITGLKAGYRVTGALMTAATATSTNTSGVQSLNSGGLATVNDIVAGDFIVSVSTPVVQKVISTLTQDTYLASTTTTLTPSSPLNSFKWRALPL